MCISNHFNPSHHHHPHHPHTLQLLHITTHLKALDITNVVTCISNHFPPQAINNEEELLEWEVTPFPQIMTIAHLKEPYSRLFNTAGEFLEKNDKWMNGE